MTGWEFALLLLAWAIGGGSPGPATLAIAGTAGSASTGFIITYLSLLTVSCSGGTDFCFPKVISCAAIKKRGGCLKPHLAFCLGLRASKP